MVTKNRPTGKTVLLFSGGMDSLIAAWLLKPDILLMLWHGQRYEGVEARGLASLRRASLLPEGPCLMESRALSLGEFEREDAIIPLRNLLFVAIAAQYGEDVYMAAVSGDRSLDKSPEFFRRSGDLLTYLFGEQHWCVARDVRVHAPYLAQTKTEMVRQYLAAGCPAEALLASTSCYDLAEVRMARGCGTCKPCFRKWVALRNNGIAVPYGYFLRDPWTAPWLPDAMPAVRAGTYRGAEDRDWLSALETKEERP